MLSDIEFKFNKLILKLDSKLADELDRLKRDVLDELEELEQDYQELKWEHDHLKMKEL